MKKQRGITLISLSITIIVMLILITTSTYNINSYVENKRKSDITADLQIITEKVEHYYAKNKELPILNKYANLEKLQDVISNNDNENYYVVDLEKIDGAEALGLVYGKGGYNEIKSRDISEIITDITDIFIVNEQSHKIYYPAGVKVYDNVMYNLYENISQTQSAILDLKTDGSWNENKKVNSPKLEGTGLTAIYWDESGNEIELTKENAATDWENWYDYEKQKWANAVTKDENGNITGYFVWIPRYAYKITSNLGTSTTGEIEIVFVDINNKNGNTEYLETYPTVENNAMTNYVVHPAFTKNIINGGWDEDIEGFWVAKYPAGYQANTIKVYEDGGLSTDISNNTDTVIYSNTVYKNVDENYNINVYGNIIANSTQISYPVFKPLTYVYNNISASDMFNISRRIESSTNFYGLNNIDSHMQKDSEWGAVAYLTQSVYGRNKTQININNYYTSESSSYRVVLTGVYADDSDSTATDAISVVNAYNTTNGQKGSSTGNIYGVYDLNGCVYERTTGYIANELGDTNRINYASSYATTIGSKYATVYSHDEENEKNIYGDALLETSTDKEGETSWNGDLSEYPKGQYCLFVRGGCYADGYTSGQFAFSNSDGAPHSLHGFRVVLIPN